MPFTLKHILGSLLIGALAFAAFGLYGSAVQRNWAEEQISGELKASAQAQAQRLSTSLSNLWRVVEMLSEEASAQPGRPAPDVNRSPPALPGADVARLGQSRRDSHCGRWWRRDDRFASTLVHERVKKSDCQSHGEQRRVRHRAGQARKEQGRHHHRGSLCMCGHGRFRDLCYGAGWLARQDHPRRQ